LKNKNERAAPNRSTKPFSERLNKRIQEVKTAFVFQRNSMVKIQISGMAVPCCTEESIPSEQFGSCTCSSDYGTDQKSTFRQKLIKESLKAVWMITKFMGLAFFLNALINLYIPQEWIGKLLTQQGFVSIIIAALIGVPVYTSNLTALPFVGGLLQLGLHPGAALAFLISGPLTTIPAMAAVYGIVNRKVFGLYVAFSLLGSLFFGILFYLLN